MRRFNSRPSRESAERRRQNFLGSASVLGPGFRISCCPTIVFTLPACDRRLFCNIVGSMKISHLRLLLFCAALALITAGCTGQPANETKPAVEKGGQTAAVRTSGDVVKVGESGVDLSGGGSAELAIPISIQPGYHVNANPATFDYLIATELTVDTSDGITFGKPVYPAAEKKKFQFAEQPLAVYEGNIQVRLPLQAAPNAARGKRSLAAHLRVQACDEEKCFPPATLQAMPAIDLK